MKAIQKLIITFMVIGGGLNLVGAGDSASDLEVLKGFDEARSPWWRVKK